MDSSPDVEVRWMHAAPFSSTSAAGKPGSQKWTPFSEKDNRDLERAYKQGKETRVPVAQDKLFEVDVNERKLYPVYWSGSSIDVLRATWFLDAGSGKYMPAEEALADRLEEGYQIIKPWLSSYQDELESSLEIGASAEAKLRYAMPAEKEKSKDTPDKAEEKSENVDELTVDEKEEKISRPSTPTVSAANNIKLDDSSYVIYQSADSARLFSDSMASKIAKKVLTAINTKHRHAGGTYIVRGFSAARAIFDNKDQKKSSQKAEGEKEQAADTDSAKAQRVTQEALEDNEDAQEEVEELVLVIHGIGQKLSETYNAFDFTHAMNLFRNTCKEQMQNEKVAEIVRGRRFQVLPIRWRSQLNVDYEKKLEDAKTEGTEDERNIYALDDITIKESIPAVRTLVSDVMLDIPLYLSQHKNKMISAVCQEANRVYRLFCQRNPAFHQKGGKVSIIGHSLGSALSCDILSNQPTYVDSIDLKAKVETEPDNSFIFNTRLLILVGSPLAFFMLLNSSQLIARAGRPRAEEAGSDASYDKPGTYGCLAIDAIYNVFHIADPIAYRLNPCIDRSYAQSLKPTIIPPANPGFFSSVSKYFDGMPSFPAFPSKKEPARPTAHRAGTSSIELAQTHFSSLDRAERRFAALNPNGTVDYILPSAAPSVGADGTGGMFDYVNMITAHGDYWSSVDFARFFVVELFREDIGITMPSSGGAQAGIAVPTFTKTKVEGQVTRSSLPSSIGKGGLGAFGSSFKLPKVKGMFGSELQEKQEETK